MTGSCETSLALANRHVVEAEQHHARQVGLIAELSVTEQACARQVLAEIERTLAIARTHRSLLQSLKS